MEKGRLRSRKRYCCYYCNTFFYQVDSWQRHNRKHTGVEIECEDCGEMCSDHLELKSHQRMCEAYRVYSEELCTQHPLDDHQALSKQLVLSERDTENMNTHETPDSTSKQESTPENDGVEKTMETNMEQDTRSRSSVLGDELKCREEVEENSESNIDTSNEVSQNIETNILSQNNELDDLIGEDKAANGMHDDTDPATEALIGIDEDEVTQMNKEATEHKPLESNIGVDTQIIMKVDGFTLEGKRHPNMDHRVENKESRCLEVPSFFNRPSPVGAVMDSVQTISLDNGEMNKKYQPYFCKNCGARFTRKDSVTRHLKKGTCSGKSAIVCNICGKVFAEMFELQDHFKMEHKNVVFTPTVVHRSILPRGDNPEQGAYTPYPTHYVLHDQHLVPVTRPYLHPEQTYRPMPPGLQTMFYGSPSNYTPRPGYPPPAGHFHDPFQSQAIELKYSPNSQVGKDITFVNNPGKLVIQRVEDVARKRDFSREHFPRDHNLYDDSNYIIKKRKLELEPSSKSRDPLVQTSVSSKSPVHQNINLSEYTNNAMSAKQYYDNRFSKSETSNGKDEAPRAHQCKVCGLEFPRFEYLLTHLRKHKEKLDIDRGDALEEKPLKELSSQPVTSQPKDVSYPKSSSEVFLTVSLSDSSSSSSDDNENVQKLNFVMSQSSENPPAVYTTHEPVPVVAQQSFAVHHPINDRYHDQQSIYATQHTPLASGAFGEGGIETLTPGVDGKFRPFICENCGQRFTRKDSLVRHAKKQTCFEEITDLKCKQCDKTFRYHKCLLQHQELVHGISHDEQKQQLNQSEDEGSESDKSYNYKNDIDEENGISGNTEGKYLTNNDVDHLKSRIKSEYFGRQVSLYSQHINRNHPLKAREIPHQGDRIPLQQESKSVTRELVATSQDHLPLREEQFRHRDIPSSQRKASNQSQSVLPTFVPPIKEERFKTLDSTQGNNQESQYIGYCMLPRPFQCEYCGDRFAHRHSLKRHVRRHLGIGIPCHDCGKLYRDQSEWRRHQKSIHNRHYEKYEVPSRMSFRDGVEQGLIGIIPNSDYENAMDNEEGSGSEKSDEEVSMAKRQRKYESPPVTIMETIAEPSHSTLNSTVGNQDIGDDFPTNGEKSPTGNKEEKLKAFDFKAHSTGDKDTRKSVLDLYLCSPNSDEDLEKSISEK